jgi:hypothetical protein
MDRRKFRRYRLSLDAEFYAGDRILRGVSSNLSQGGLLLRTQHSLSTGSLLHITLFLPDGKTARVKGKALRNAGPGSGLVRNGIGVRLIEHDQAYSDYIEGLRKQAAGSAGDSGEAGLPGPEEKGA